MSKSIELAVAQVSYKLHQNVVKLAKTVNERRYRKLSDKLNSSLAYINSYADRAAELRKDADALEVSAVQDKATVNYEYNKKFAKLAEDFSDLIALS